MKTEKGFKVLLVLFLPENAEVNKFSAPSAPSALSASNRDRMIDFILAEDTENAEAEVINFLRLLRFLRATLIG